MSASYQVSPTCSLSITALEDAALRYLGGARLSDCTLYTCIYNRRLACQLQGEHGFRLVLIPPEIMRSYGSGWLLECDGDKAWSDGVN